MNRVLIVIGCVVFSLTSSSKSHSIDQAWSDFIDVQQELRSVLYAKFPDQVSENPFDALNFTLKEADLVVFNQAGLDSQRLDKLTERIRQILNQMANFNSTHAETPEVEVGVCRVWTDDALYGVSITNDILGGVLASIQWACEETVGGFNSVQACVYPEIAVQAFASVTEIGDFCIKDIAHGVSQAVFETNQAIAKQLNDMLNEPISSRASVQAVTDLSVAIAAAQAQLDQYFPSYFPAIKNRQQSTQQAVGTQITQLLDLQTKHQAIGKQQIILNARLQDSNERAEDVRLGSVQVRQINRSLYQSATMIQAKVTAINQRQFQVQQQLHHRHTIMTLLQTDGGQVLKLQLPMNLGGELEQVRELIVHNIQMANLSGFNTTTAEQLFSQGDQQFNKNLYRQAYVLYTEAYRALTDNTRSPK